MSAITDAFPTLEAYDAELERRNLRGQWIYDRQSAGASRDGPAPAGIPFLWPWSLAERTLTELTEIFTDTATARRNVSFINPGPGAAGTTHTLMMGMQMVTPGEIAWAHRHSMNALRFVVDGSPDLYTVVDGERCVMETNDLVLTPAYTWHDHHNDSDGNRIWIDILDAQVFGFLKGIFFQPLGETVQPLRDKAADFLSRRAAMVRPAWEARASERIPFRYPWADVWPVLKDMAAVEASEHDDVILHYAHPITGGPTMPTIDCFVQSLRPGFHGARRRRTASTVYYVIDGEGTTIAGDTELHWTAGDSFAVPNWTWHEHLNRSNTAPAVLFSATDAPILDAIGAYREEPGALLRKGAYPAVPADLSFARAGAAR